MLKEKLIQLLKEFPERFAKQTFAEACDDGAEDIQAVVIEALPQISAKLQEPAEDENVKLLVEDLSLTTFGATFFNLYTMRRAGYEPFLSTLAFSNRKRVVDAMLTAMINEEQAIVAEQRYEAFKDAPGETFRVDFTSTARIA